MHANCVYSILNISKRRAASNTNEHWSRSYLCERVIRREAAETEGSYNCKYDGSSKIVGTDLELSSAARLLKTDIFVFKYVNRGWNRFSGHSFNDKQNVHE